jgi:Cu+-exporting ATPase
MGLFENEKPFCCRGCAMVYAILSENDLNRFYDLDDQAGTRVGDSPEAGKYDFLADADLKRRLIDFTDGTTTRMTFHLPHIH